MMNDHEDHDITAAIALWEPLAAFAWDRFLAEGRGVVLVESTALREAAKQAIPGLTAELTQFVVERLGYVCARDVPPSDDFAPIIAEYDPQRQVALLVHASGSAADEGRPDAAHDNERLYVLETSERHARPTPGECHRRWAR